MPPTSAFRRLAMSALNWRARLRKEVPILDPFSPAFRRDPYPLFRELRERDPVHFHPFGIWLITRYADAVTVWNDPRFGHPDYADKVLKDGSTDRFEIMRSRLFVSRNPPDHTRIKNIMLNIFTRGQVDEYRPRMRAIVDQLLDRVAPSGRMDAIRDLGEPLPLTLISEIMGIPAEDRMRLSSWSKGVVAAMDVSPDEAAHRRGREGAENFHVYFLEEIRKRRERPARDVLGRLVAAQKNDPEFTDEELTANASLLFSAGHETTVNLTGLGIYSLLRNPDQWALLQNDPSLVPRAVEETLRYETPAQFFGRMALEDVSLNGKMIRKGQTVYILVGAVNHDPDVFKDPDRFDLMREPNRHLSFGHGIHACIGQYLARAEVATALTALLERFPRLRLDGEATTWGKTIGGRGLTSLPLRFDG